MTAWNEALDEENFSVGIGTPADLNSQAESYTFIDCMMPQVSYETEQDDTPRARRSRGAGSHRLTGFVRPRVALQWPLKGQLATYNYASDTPGFKGANILLDVFGGSAAIAHQAAGIEPSDGNTISLVSSTGKLGCLVAGRESSGLVAAMGFIKSLSGTGPYTAQLFEDMKAQPGSGIARIPTLTTFPGTTAASPRVIRVCGEHADSERLYLGWYPNKFTFARLGGRWVVSAEGIAYGGEVVDNGEGGLQPWTDCLMVEPMVSRGGDRVVLGSNIFTDYNDGTVDADGTCDLRDLEIEIDIPHYVVPCGPGNEGVLEVGLRSPQMIARFSLPETSDFFNGGKFFADQAWREMLDTSLSLYLGDTPGRGLAINMPRGITRVFPGAVFKDGIRHRPVELEAGYYDGDGADTDAGNKPWRISQW